MKKSSKQVLECTTKGRAGKDLFVEVVNWTISVAIPALLQCGQDVRKSFLVKNLKEVGQLKRQLTESSNFEGFIVHDS